MSDSGQITIGVSSKDMQLLEDLRAEFASQTAVVSVGGPTVYEYHDTGASLPHMIVGFRPSASNPAELVHEIVKRRLLQDADCRHRKVLIYAADVTPVFIAECSTGKSCRKPRGEKRPGK